MRTAEAFRSSRVLPCLALVAASLAGCGGGGPPGNPINPGGNVLPDGVTQHSVTTYSATAVGTGSTAATQDLLTAGLGATGLGSAVVPVYADPLHPTAPELRRNAIHSNYRGLVDFTSNGGYGRFYGPNVTAAGTVTSSEGLVPGREYFASLDDGSGRKRVAMAVLVPDSFDPSAPCIVLGPSSGSRGVYGAIATAGEWGLKRGCAVALTDTGKGVGLHDLSDDTVNRVDGTRATRAAAGALNHFAALITDAARSAYNLIRPNRLALKHAHSQQNPEKDWGSDTLVAARYAFFAINDRYGSSARPTPFTASNTLVIAGSVSNGGAAVLRAAEADTTGLIDGVVAGEPVTEMPTASGYTVRFNGLAVALQGRPLADIVTYGNLFQPCAQLAAAASLGVEASFFNWMTATGMNARAQSRCASLAARGLIVNGTLAQQANDALLKLREYGWTVEHDQMHNSYWGTGNGPILSAMYPLAYGRFAVDSRVCETSFAVADATGNPVAPSAAFMAQSFAIANGTANGTPGGANQPPTPIYDDASGGPRAWQFAASRSTGSQDFGLDTALCQRALVTGLDPVTGNPLTTTSTPTAAQAMAVQNGILETFVSGGLRAKPALVVAGRSDALVPVNHNARAYAAYNRQIEGSPTRLRYIEVLNAQHFDGFLPLAGFDNRFVPLHVYFNEAMDRMFEHLRTGAALPPSQVVRAVPRGGAPGAAPALTAANVPRMNDVPLPGDLINVDGTGINVPQ